jgi:hypothetical protein
MEAIALLALLGMYGCLCGVLGGAAGMILTQRTYERIVRRVTVEVEAQPVTARITAPAVVDVQVRVPAIAPLTVPIVMAPTPTTRELADRVLAAVPDIGPTSLAEIIGCAKSTAHTIIQEWRQTSGAPDVEPPQREELSAWPPLLAAGD